MLVNRAANSNFSYYRVQIKKKNTYYYFLFEKTYHTNSSFSVVERSKGTFSFHSRSFTSWFTPSSCFFLLKANSLPFLKRINKRIDDEEVKAPKNVKTPPNFIFSTILLNAAINTADRMHLKRFKHPVAVDVFVGKRSTIRVVEKVKMQLENSDANPLMQRTAAKGALTVMHHPYAQNPLLLKSKVTNAGCNLALKILKVYLGSFSMIRCTKLRSLSCSSKSFDLFLPNQF